MNLALIAGLATAAVSRENARQARGGNLRGKPGGIPKGTRPGAVRRFAQRYGRDAAIKKFGKDAVTRFGGSAGRSAVTNLGRRGLVGVFLEKGGTKAGLKFLKNFISPIVKRIPIIGGLVIDFA